MKNSFKPDIPQAVDIARNIHKVELFDEIMAYYKTHNVDFFEFFSTLKSFPDDFVQSILDNMFVGLPEFRSKVMMPKVDDPASLSNLARIANRARYVT